MKKILISAVTIILMIIFISCSGTPQNVSSDLKSSINSLKSINYSQIPSSKQLTLLVQHSIDIDNDGNEEKVELFTNAPKNDKGEPMWDDLNHWHLNFTKDNRVITLFDGDISLGKLDFWLYSDNKKQFHIAWLTTSCTGIQMFDNRYDPNKQAFISSEIVSIQDVNMQFYYKQ